MSTVATRQQKTSEPTRQQKIAALEKELSDLLEEDIEKANERLRKASIEVAKIKRKLERAEQVRGGQGTPYPSQREGTKCWSPTGPD